MPDFLLLTDSGPVVVDVKPQCRVRKPEIAFVLSWTRERKRIGRGVWRRPWSGVSWFGDHGQVGLVDPVDAGHHRVADVGEARYHRCPAPGLGDEVGPGLV